jgi:hypothetical protein
MATTPGTEPPQATAAVQNLALPAGHGGSEACCMACPAPRRPDRDQISGGLAANRRVVVTLRVR